MTEQHPLVFIHGSGDNGSVWRPQIEHFGPQWSFPLDLPGHGQRPDTVPVETTVQGYAQAVQSIVTEELQRQKPIFIGHSLGGAIALTLALDYPNDVSGIVLVGTGARLRILPAILAEARDDPKQARLNLSHLAMSPTVAPTVAQAILQEQSPRDAHMLYRDLAACNAFESMSRLYEISMPTLIICGMDDRLTPVKYSEYLHKNIHNSTLLILSDAGHYVMREQPQAVNRGITEWLAASFPPSTH